ncbi:PQQ-binding-like beta-propeller repeat protein [bacterium]|nr:PQQ-binding-like beta-propeller repeat protein [bacterium]
MKSCNFLLLLFLTIFGCGNRPDVIWSFKTGGPIYHSPAVGGNKVIVGSNDQNVYALDVQTGKVIWKTDLGERILMTPLVEGNSIYVGSASGYFYHLDGKDGSVRWRFKTGAKLEFDPCADNEGIYFGSHDGNFYKITREGQKLWALETNNVLTSSCTFYKDMVITTAWDSNLYALRRNTGEVVWKNSTKQYNYGIGVVVGDSIFYGTHDAFYRFDATIGKTIFQKKAAYHSHVVALQNFIFTEENGLTKRSLDGQVLKNLRFTPSPEFVPVVVKDYIVTADSVDTLYGISAELEILWKFRAKNSFWSAGALQDGIYYIGNRDTYVYALRLPQ